MAALSVLRATLSVSANDIPKPLSVFAGAMICKHGIRLGQTSSLCRSLRNRARMYLVMAQIGPDYSQENEFLILGMVSKKPAYHRNGLPRAALGGAAGDLSKYPQRAKEAILRPDRVELRRGIIPPLSPGSSVSPA